MRLKLIVKYDRIFLSNFHTHHKLAKFLQHYLMALFYKKNVIYGAVESLNSNQWIMNYLATLNTFWCATYLTVIWICSESRTTDTQWRHKSKISEKMGRYGRQNMLPPYLKIWEWEWIFGCAVKAFSSLGVLSPWNKQWKERIPIDKADDFT